MNCAGCILVEILTSSCSDILKILMIFLGSSDDITNIPELTSRYSKDSVDAADSSTDNITNLPEVTTEYCNESADATEEKTSLPIIENTSELSSEHENEEIDFLSYDPTEMIVWNRNDNEDSETSAYSESDSDEESDWYLPSDKENSEKKRIERIEKTSQLLQANLESKKVSSVTTANRTPASNVRSSIKNGK